MTLLKRKEKRDTTQLTSMSMYGKHSFIISTCLYIKLHSIFVVMKQQPVITHLEKQELVLLGISEISHASPKVILLDL